MDTNHLKGQRILAVDLDGTLLRSDMLFESFWSATSRDWRAPLSAALALSGGRAALKRSLAGRIDIDVTTLPYDPQVIDYIKTWRSEGGTALLVTASDEMIAQQIAAHLGIFDAVHGSDGTRNLKSAEKAAFLTERFGKGGYDYMGDAEADLPVWQNARKAVTVNLSASLQTRVEALGVEVEHLSTSQPGVRDYLKAIRVHQWLKNFLVFLPMFAAHQLDVLTFLQSLLAFVVFSIVASSIYVLNDLLDLRSDRAHPTKCKRPFAAGTIPIAHASYLIVGLMGLGLILSMFLGGAFVVAMLLYVVFTTAYSLWLKRKAIVDIGTLAGLYTLRIIAGAVATGIPLSMWLLAFSIFFFLSLAIVKRQAELMDSAARGKLKAAGRGYVVDDLPVLVMMAVASGYVSVLVMALYIQSDTVSQLYTTPKVLGAICGILLYWISRVILMAHRGHMHEDPVVFAARDRVSQICALMIIAVAVGGNPFVSAMRIAMLYALFAMVATVINLGAQRLVLSWNNDATGFALAVFCGTLAGLVVKYVLDKRWIFADLSTGLKAHGQKFTLYTIMGVVTTAIFWTTETAFWLIWGTDAMRELGAVLGLSVGYVTKYFLDRRFVFQDSRKAAPS